MYVDLFVCLFVCLFVLLACLFACLYNYDACSILVCMSVHVCQVVLGSDLFTGLAEKGCMVDR